MTASKWRRPPTKYEEDEEANGDSYLLFKLLDKDQNAYLDIKEVVNARRVVVESVQGDNAISEMMHGVMDQSDQNNDGKVIEEEWHDFLRSLYEVLGRKKWMEITRTWRKTLSEEKAAELKEAAEVKEESQPKVVKTKSRKSVAANEKEKAATKIQARFRGNKAREEVAAKKSAKNNVVHDAEKVQMAKESGRHYITVISQDSAHGTRADFYLDGKEIEFNTTHGDLGRGLQVVTIDPDSAQVVARTTYDVAPPHVKTECGRLVSDFKALPEGYLVLVANKAHGTKDLNAAAINALRSIGATTEDFGKKEVSYALIGCKGCLASAERNGHTAEAEAFVSFAKEERAGLIKDNKPRDLTL